MKHLIWTLAVTASLAAPLPAASQHAVPRGGGSDGGGSSSSGGSSGGSSSGSSGGSVGGSSSGGSSSSDGGSSGSSWAPPRHPGGSSSGGSRSGGSGSTASGRRSPGSSTSSGSGSGSGSDRVVGGTSGHTRDGRPITGYAIPRGTVVPPGPPGGDYYYYPRGADWYYSPWYYSRYSPFYYSSYGASLFGLAYIWDPFWFGGDPYGDRWGFGGGGYGYGGGGGGGDEDEDYGQGALRIKVTPREAKVLVDGTFAGTVDDFDGNFQKLRLDEGAHKVELQADGFEPLRFDVLIVVGQTVTYKGKLREH